MYTTACYQYSPGKRDKLTLTSYLWAAETSIQDQHTLLDCSIFSTLLPVEALVQQNVDIIYCQFCTFGTRTTSINKFCSLHTAITYLPPLHRWFLGPNFPTARNSAGVMFSKRTSWRSSWWSHPIAYVDCPSLRIKDGNWNNTNQEVSLSNMGGPLYHVSLSKDVCLTGQHLLHTTFPIYISGTVQDTFLFSVPLMSP